MKQRTFFYRVVVLKLRNIIPAALANDQITFHSLHLALRSYLQSEILNFFLHPSSHSDSDMANFLSNCGKLKEGDEEVVGNCHLGEKKEVQEDASRRLISSDVTAPRHWNQDSSEIAFGEELAFGRNVKFEGDIENAREKDGATKIRSNRLSEDVGESNKVCCLAGGQEGILLAKEEEESEENGFKLTNFVFTKPPWLSGEAVGSRRRRRDFVDDNGTRIKEHDFVGSASGSFGKSTTVGETEERSQEELEVIHNDFCHV